MIHSIKYLAGDRDIGPPGLMAHGTKYLDASMSSNIDYCRSLCRVDVMSAEHLTVFSIQHSTGHYERTDTRGVSLQTIGRILICSRRPHPISVSSV